LFWISYARIEIEEFVVKETRLVIALAVLWIVSGAIVGFSLEALFSLQWVVPCTSLNLMMGMILLLLVTRNEWARRMFYEGPRAGEDSSPLIGMLWALPLVLLIVGGVWWLLTHLLR